MELPHYDELHKICRICLKSDLLVSSIFSAIFSQMRPIQMIEKLQIFTLQPEDNLPTLLCQSCLYRLLDAYNLKQLAESSERRLRDYMGFSNNGVNCGLSLHTIQQESSSTASFASTAAIPDTLKDAADATAAIYANICDMFERNIQPHIIEHNNHIEVEATSTLTVGATAAPTDDVLNDIEIDVSSLTRDDTLSEAFANAGGSVCVDGAAVTSYAADFVKELPLNAAFHEFKEDELSIAMPAKCMAPRSKVLDKCPQCGKVFNYSGYLEAHIRTHTGDKPFKCKLCSRHFTQSSNLLLHARTHTGERRYQCEICASFFTTSSNLKAHRLTHTERRAFECERCERSFKSARELRRHEPIHKSVKDVVCALCEKAFAKRSYLAAHMAAVHRSVRRHKCSECAKVFGSRSNLVCHMRTHTGEKPFQCKYCSWKFNQSSALARHMKKHLTSRGNVVGQDGSVISSFLQNTAQLPLLEKIPLEETASQQASFSLIPSLVGDVDLTAPTSNAIRSYRTQQHEPQSSNLY